MTYSFIRNVLLEGKPHKLEIKPQWDKFQPEDIVKSIIGEYHGIFKNGN